MTPSTLKMLIYAIFWEWWLVWKGLTKLKPKKSLRQYKRYLGCIVERWLIQKVIWSYSCLQGKKIFREYKCNLLAHFTDELNKIKDALASNPDSMLEKAREEGDCLLFLRDKTFRTLLQKTRGTSDQMWISTSKLWIFFREGFPRSGIPNSCITSGSVSRQGALVLLGCCLSCFCIQS